MVKRSLVGFILFVFTAFVWAAPSAQADQLNIDIVPVKDSLELQPGSRTKHVISLRNSAETARTMFFDAEDFTVGDAAGNISFFEPGQDRDASYSLQDWLSFDQSSVEVPAGGEAEFTVTIDVPIDAEAGGHYAAVFAQTADPALVENQAAITTVSRIGSLLLVTVPGEVTRGLELTETSATGDTTFGALSAIDATIGVTNTGNVHVEPSGTITLSGIGVSADEAAINVDQSAVLPGTDVRQFTNSIELNSSGLIPPMGPITVDFAVEYADGETLTASQTIWVLPLMHIGAMIAGVLVLLFVLRRIQLSYARK